MPQIIDVPGVGQVEFPDGMSDAEITAAIQKNAAERPATMNPNLQAQGTKYRENMTPPESVMDPKYPAYKTAQDQADALDAVSGLVGLGAGAVMAPGAKLTRKAANFMMRSAIKPSSVEDPAKVRRAIETALTTKSGGMSGLNMDAIRERGGQLSSQVKALVQQNPGAIPVGNLSRYGDDLLGKLRYTNQVDDLAAARGARSNFLSGEAFADLGKRERELVTRALMKDASARDALQTSGMYQTMAAQQENLAHGGRINLGPRQPANAPYMNVGAEAAGGRAALSPSAYPVDGYPRIAGRYTHNIDRVPEAKGAAQDAAAIAQQRKAEADFARFQLDSLPPHERAEMIPLEQAQAMKQALYAKLGDKAYGAGLKPVADREMNKAIAQGLRGDIERLEPGVIPLNAEAAELWNLNNIAGRGVATASNKNPLGLNLGVATGHPASAAAFALDRSQLAKALVARALYGSRRVPGAILGGSLGYGVPEMLERDAVVDAMQRR